MAKSILVVYTKPVEGREAEFDEWYTSVHLPEVVRLEGFTAARRYRFVPEKAGEAHPDLPWLAIYEIEDGMLDAARSALAAALRSSSAAVREGRTPELMPSDALHRERGVAWFEEIAAVQGS
ncbi:MAG: hypothetical protein IR160_12255 [Salinibacterium sp.]|nr:hypothetical protein [Salinibacterium sp.]MBF0673343.1 hypothetical protein [Salinibacterium sp.]